MFQRRRVLDGALPTGFGLLGWLFYPVISSAILIAERQPESLQLSWQYDWHVYLAGARDLVDRSLYRGALTLDGYPLPVEVFNQTPFAAAWALPFLPLDVVTGGRMWLALMVISIAAGMIISVAVLGLRRPVLLGGIGLLAYSLSPWFWVDVLLGNINGLMFLLVAAFAWLHLHGRDRAAGLMLGIAIATKPWPLAFLPLLARERRWQEMRWAMAFVLLQAIVFSGWLGADVLPGMAAEITSPVPISEGVPVFGWSLIRETYGLPAWGGLVIGLLLLVVPARGRIGLGNAILAGLTLLVVNLWQHYLPVIALGLLLVIIPVARDVWVAFRPGGCRSAVEA